MRTSLQYLVYFIQQEFLEIHYYNTVGTKMHRHTASRKDLLDGARLEIRLSSTQDEPILRVPKGMLVNLTCN